MQQNAVEPAATATATAATATASSNKQLLSGEMFHSMTRATPISGQVKSDSRNRNLAGAPSRGHHQDYQQLDEGEQFEDCFGEPYEAEGRRQSLAPVASSLEVGAGPKGSLFAGEDCENARPTCPVVSAKMEMSAGREQMTISSAAPLENGRDADGLKMPRNGRVLCAGCQAQIRDKFIFSVIDQFWHQDCVQCADCSLKLSDRCYTLNGKLYCKLDYWHRFGPKCFACQQSIEQSELVQRIKSNRVYHLKCFTCNECRRPLEQGEQLHLVDDRSLLCKQDFQRLSLRCRPAGENANNNNNNNAGAGELKRELAEGIGDEAGAELAHHHEGRLAGADPLDGELLLGAAEARGEPDFERAAEHEDEDEENRLNGRRHSLPAGGHLLAAADGGELQATSIKTEPQQPSKQQPKLGSSTTTNTGNSATQKAFEAGAGADLGQDDLVDANGKRRGPRTTIKPKQLETLRHAFESAPKPSRHIREQLSQETGLAMRVIQVWFQNRRSKERRMRNSNGSARRNFLRSQSRRLRVGTQTIVSLPAAPGAGLGPADGSLIAAANSGGALKMEAGGRTSGAGANSKQSKGSTSASSASSTASTASAISRQRGSASPADTKKSNQSLNDFSSSTGPNSGSGFTYFSDSSNQGTESSFAALTSLSAGGSTGVTGQQQFAPNSNGIIQQQHSPPESAGSLTPTGCGGGGATGQTILMGVDSPSGGGAPHPNGPSKGQQSTNQQQQYQSSPGMKNTPPPAPIYQQQQQQQPPMHHQFLGTPPQQQQQPPPPQSQHHSMGHPHQLMSNSHHQIQQQPAPPHHFQHLHDHPHQHPPHQMAGVPSHQHHQHQHQHHHHQMLQPGPVMNPGGPLPAGLMSSHQSQTGPPSVVQW